MTRRNFTTAFTAGLAAQSLTRLGAQRSRQLKLGVSTLAWNVSSTTIDNFEMALKDISELGYWGFETVDLIIRSWETDLPRLIEKYRLPLKAGYIDVQVTDPALRKENVANVIRLAKLVKKHGGNYVVMSTNGRRRQQAPDTFNFAQHKANMVAALNEYGMAVVDLGLRAGLHPHTGSVVEKRDEVYGIMNAVDPRYMTFAPDTGQIQKGGTDAAQVVKDFAKITTHMHLKDFSNGKYMGGYCPLGMGVVDVESILNALEEAGNKPDVMHELDRGNAPMTARETAAFSKAYLMRLGYQFQR